MRNQFEDQVDCFFSSLESFYPNEGQEFHFKIKCSLDPIDCFRTPSFGYFTSSTTASPNSILLKIIKAKIREVQDRINSDLASLLQELRESTRRSDRKKGEKRKSIKKRRPKSRLTDELASRGKRLSILPEGEVDNKKFGIVKRGDLKFQEPTEEQSSDSNEEAKYYETEKALLYQKNLSLP